MMYLAFPPYSHSDPAVRRWRYDAACRATAAMLRMGISVFSPVVHSHPLTRYGLPGDWGFWEDYDRAHLERCDALAVLTMDGWRESEGLQVEMAIAKELSMPVRLIDPAEVGIRAENAPAAETGAPEVSD